MNFAKSLKTPFSTDHLRENTSDTRMQIVVLYNLNLSLQYVTINFTISLVRVFTLPHASISSQFLRRLIFY